MDPSPYETTKNTCEHCGKYAILFGGFLLLFATPAAAMNDPVLGRWLTRDPLYYKASRLAAWNRLGSLRILSSRGQAAALLSFARSSPPRFVDPAGLTCEDGVEPSFIMFLCPPVPPGYNLPPNNCPETHPACGAGDAFCSEGDNPFHPGAEECFRGYGLNAQKQCCYDSMGCLIYTGADAGSWDSVTVALGDNPKGTCVWSYKGLFWHAWYDVAPYIADQILEAGEDQIQPFIDAGEQYYEDVVTTLEGMYNPALFAWEIRTWFD